MICTICKQDPRLHNNWRWECSVAECPHRHLSRQQTPTEREKRATIDPPISTLFDNLNDPKTYGEEP